MSILELVGLIAIGTLLGTWIERIVSFARVRRELSNVVDRMDGKAA